MNINELAKRAGFPERRAFSDLSDLHPRLERFAALVRAETLEEAAGVCDEYEELLDYSPMDCAAAIRALKEET